MAMASSKKVLYVITKGSWGGAQRYVFDLATGCGPTYVPHVALGAPGALAEKLKAKGVAVTIIPSLTRDVSLLADSMSFFALYALYRKERPDIVHLNSSKAAGLGALAARLAGVPRVLFTVHGWPFLEPRHSVVRALIWFLSWLSALLSHTVIVISRHDYTLGEAMPFVGRKTVLIYNGIAPFSLGDGTRVRSHFPPKVRITGVIGELTKNKNQIALIERARNDPTLYVAIIGEGEDRPLLEASIRAHGLEKRVKLLGFIDAKDALAGIDCLMLPSLKEGLPYILLEAKAVGLPIEARYVGGVGEILDEEHDFTLLRMLRETLALY
jgi:glycosyltransferase involved in cell wall biosynthesis